MLLVDQIFQEVDGKWSFSRIASGAWLAACITWVSALFAVKHVLPDGPTFFGMAAVVTSLYTANKIAAAITGPPDQDEHK